jgi:hypothetical protein
MTAPDPVAVRVGYLILAHHMPRHLLRLVAALTSGEARPICIHIDKKSRSHFSDRVIDRLTSVTDVAIASTRRVYWGHITMIDALTDCLHYMLGRWPEVTHIKFLTGQDYPVRPLDTFTSFLGEHPICSALEWQPIPNPIWQRGGEPDGGLGRVAYLHLHLAGRFVRTPIRRAIPAGVRPFVGSAFWCLQRTHARWILDHYASWRRWLRFSQVVEETFFQTALKNSPYGDQIVNNGMTYVAWPDDSPHPKILSLEDDGPMIASDCSFARKFDERASLPLLDVVDQRVAFDTSRLMQ